MSKSNKTKKQKTNRESHFIIATLQTLEGYKRFILSEKDKIQPRLKDIKD